LKSTFDKKKMVVKLPNKTVWGFWLFISLYITMEVSWSSFAFSNDMILTPFKGHTMVKSNAFTMIMSTRPQQRFQRSKINFRSPLSSSLTPPSSTRLAVTTSPGITQEEGDGGEKTKTESNQSSSSSLGQRIDKIIFKLQNIPPLTQLFLLFIMYVIHLVIFTQNSLLFPFQLIPNERGWFQSIGLDSVAGIISFVSIQLLRRRQIRRKQKVTIPSLFSGVYDKNIQTAKRRIKETVSSNANVNKYQQNQPRKKSTKNYKNKYNIPAPWRFPLRQANAPSPRVTSTVALTLLVSAYFFTGRLAAMIELYLYALAGMGVPMTIAMHRSLVVLGGHLVWVAIGSGILSIVLRPQPFFGGGKKQYFVERNNKNSAQVDKEHHNVDDKNGNNEGDQGLMAQGIQDIEQDDNQIILKKQKYKWFSNKWNSNWLWWTIGGYFISSWFFNIADFLNQIILPAHVFELAGEGVVSQLINPENNDIAASLVGYIAPCLSAPWWEEVLYRGFLLPALTLNMKFWPAVFVSGVVFSIHHVSTTGAIPLAILGWTWAAIYAKSGNLMVTILIHAMWNSRVFLGSWLGL